LDVVVLLVDCMVGYDLHRAGGNGVLTRGNTAYGILI